MSRSSFSAGRALALSRRFKDSVARGLSKITEACFETKGIGAFPDVQNATILWAGVSEGADFLQSLAHRLDQALDGLGFPGPQHSFHPHVTLGRLKAPTDIKNMISSSSEHAFRKTSVKTVTLFESTMKTTGSEYTSLLEWPLISLRNSSSRHREKLKPNHHPTESRSQS